MVKWNYTLENKLYFEALRKVSDELEREGITYALVGGTGVQAQIANYLCERDETDISNLLDINSRLRKTKDFDITSFASEEDFVNYFNKLQMINTEISISSDKIRSKCLTIYGRKNSANIYVNYQTGPQDLAGLDESFYNDCINNAECLNLYNGNINCNVFVAKPEYLITSKLTRNDPKDIWDIAMFLKTVKECGVDFNVEKVRNLLENSDRGELFGRLEHIKKQIVDLD